MKHFQQELALIKNEDIRAKTEAVLEQVHPDFFVAPASSTGKYHPKYALGVSGLMRHTKAAVGIFESLMGLDMSDIFSDDMKDYMRAALILHDTCKSGIAWDGKYTKHEHPILAQQLVHGVVGECEYSEVVGSLIATHMGQWNTNFRSRTILPVPQTDAAKLVHVCDYLASRKFLEYVFEEE